MIASWKTSSSPRWWPAAITPSAAIAPDAASGWRVGPLTSHRRRQRCRQEIIAHVGLFKWIWLSIYPLLFAAVLPGLVTFFGLKFHLGGHLLNLSRRFVQTNPWIRRIDPTDCVQRPNFIPNCPVKIYLRFFWMWVNLVIIGFYGESDWPKGREQLLYSRMLA